jgi:hypothetical protein
MLFQDWHSFSNSNSLQDVTNIFTEVLLASYYIDVYDLVLFPLSWKQNAFIDLFLLTELYIHINSMDIFILLYKIQLDSKFCVDMNKDKFVLRLESISDMSTNNFSSFNYSFLKNSCSFYHGKSNFSIFKIG